MTECAVLPALQAEAWTPSVTGRRHSLPSNQAAAASRYELPPPLAAPVLRHEGVAGAATAAAGGPPGSQQPATMAPPAAGSAAAAWQAAMEEARRLPSPGWAAQSSGTPDQEPQSPPQQPQQQQQAGGRGAEQPLPVPVINTGRSSPMEANDAERRRLKRYTHGLQTLILPITHLASAWVCLPCCSVLHRPRSSPLQLPMYEGHTLGSHEGH